VECGRDEVCCDHRGHALCQDCWHAAREGETPYAVFRDADNFCSSQGAYLKEEAEAKAAKRNEEERQRLVGYQRYVDEATDDRIREHWLGVLKHAELCGPVTYTAKPCDSWFGDRMAHPGYMARRRAALVAAHPEYGPGGGS
jgi:hypothetical protein